MKFIELLVVLFVVVYLFGGRRITDMFQSFGKSKNAFKQARDGEEETRKIREVEEFEKAKKDPDRIP